MNTFSCRMCVVVFVNSRLVRAIRFIDNQRSGGQWVSRTFRCPSTMPRQTTYYRRLGRSPMSLDDSISDAFSRMPQTFRFCMTTVHTAAKKQRCSGSWEWILSECQRAQSFSLKENVTTDVGFLNKVPNHDQRLTG